MHNVSLSELHEILLDIGKEFHRICTQNSIPYYMIGGTQLGATRHQGFIPWDDDMDFGVPREYFEECINCLDKQLPSRYKLLSIKNSDFVIGMFIKIVDTYTIAEYHYVKKSDEEYGINIDIFPLDKTNNRTSMFSKNWWIYRLRDIDAYRLFYLEDLPFARRTLSRTIKFLLRPLKKDCINNIIIKYLIENDGQYVANHGGLYKDKEIIHESVFGEPTLYPFEDTYFYGVNNPERYLTSLYGNWRRMPPENKRHTHLNNLFIK